MAETDRPRDPAATDRPWDPAATDRPWEKAATDRPWEKAATDRPWEKAATDRPREKAATDRPRDLAGAGRRPWGPPWASAPNTPGYRPGRPWRGPHPAWPGAAVVVTLLIQELAGRSQAVDRLVYRPFDLLTVALLAIGPLALWWRRKYPVAVLAVAGAASIGFGTFAAPRWTAMVATLVALFCVARTGRRRAAVLTAGAGYAAYVMICSVFAARLGVPAGARPDLPTAILLAACLGLTIILGGAAKVRAEHMAEMIKVRAERAKAREEQERRQASEERLRIAQELHDVLGHHLSLINVQAGVGLHLMDNRPEQAREALTAIKTASAEALREVRAVLGVLRPEEEAAPRQPALGLDRLDELTADPGLPITTTITGERRALPAEVDRAAYRIVQEALTNVRRHAASGSAVDVIIEYTTSGVSVRVRNDGAPPHPKGPEPYAAADTDGGSGIAGMRARAESLGGTLEAGPLPGGGFQVAAFLPAPRGTAPAPGAADGTGLPSMPADTTVEENA